MFKKFFKTYALILIVLFVALFIRLYKITSNPVALFGDELDLGYQAYSILKTGSDYYGNFMPLHFHSLAEWRTPLYLYSAVPTVAIFGISPLGVRLPAVVFGVLSIWAIYLLSNLLVKQKIGKTNLEFGIIPAILMSISPWHLQYSRAGFEVTQLLFFLILGVYLFFVSLEKPKYLWLSAVSFCLTPWVYSTAKLFTPMLITFLAVVYWKKIIVFPKKYLVSTLIAFLLVGAPIAISTVFGGGAQRFGYISVFTNPVTETEVGSSRLIDARARGENGAGLSPILIDRTLHNKFTYWGTNIVNNYFKSFSTEFLFIKGDPNLRHSIGTGEFYKIDALFLILGVMMFFVKHQDTRTKILIAFWILVGVIPAAITRDGGNHATRLIIVLPAYLFLTSYGILALINMVSDRYKMGILSLVFIVYLFFYSLYSHVYFTHYPFESERWWHYGFGPAVNEIKKIDSDYDKIVISNTGEPSWLFFAGYYMYDPKMWQKEFPIGNDKYLEGFGKISNTGKFYFGNATDIYSLGKTIDAKTLYLANAKEVGANLIMEPGRVPEGLKLIRAIPFPSGEPAFYLFGKNNE